MANSVLNTTRGSEYSSAEASPYDRATADVSILGLIELLLKEPADVDRLNRSAANQRELFPRFLMVALSGYLVYSCIMVLMLNLAPADAYPSVVGLQMPPARWNDPTAWSLPLAYTISVILAAGVCLPSFYFYSLLAGVRMTWLQIVSLLGKGMAVTSILLLGLLPVYLSGVIGMVIFQAPNPAMQRMLTLGLLLPFFAGVWGLMAIYMGIMDLFDSQTSPDRCHRRCFLRRLTLSWAAVYTAVLPLMIYRLWEMFSRLL
jgi:hypothetical protein